MADEQAAPPARPALSARALATIVAVFLLIAGATAYLLAPGLFPAALFPSQRPSLPAGGPSVVASAQPSPTPFAPVRAASEPHVLNFTNTLVRFQKSVEVTAASYRALVVLENQGAAATGVTLLDIIPKALAGDAGDLAFDGERTVLERDPIVLRYVALEAGQRVQREVRLPTGGEDLHYFTLVLEGELDPERQPEEFRLLYAGAYALAALDYSRLTAGQADEANRRLNLVLNNRSRALGDNLREFAGEAERLAARYPVQRVERGRAAILLEASEYLPVALARVPLELLRVLGGYDAGDAKASPLVQGAEGQLCEAPSKCEVRPAGGEMEVLVDLSAWSLEKGGLPDRLTGVLPFTFAERAGLPPFNLTLELRVNRVPLADHVFLAPRAYGLNLSFSQVLRAFNNLALPVRVSGCGFDKDAISAGGFIRTEIRRGPFECEADFAGLHRESVETPVQTDYELELKSGPLAAGWRACADRYCACEALQDALFDLVERRYLADAGFVLSRHPDAIALLRRTRSDTTFRQSYFLRGYRLEECVLPKELSVFAGLTLPRERVVSADARYSRWIVDLRTDLANYSTLTGAERANYSRYLSVVVNRA
jgi:hypothetical protein